MKIKKLTAAIGLGLGLVMAAGSAQAASKWAFQDDDIDFLWRPAPVITTTPSENDDPFTTNPASAYYDIADPQNGVLIDPSTCTAGGSGGTSCNIGFGDVLISVFEYPTYTHDGANAIPPGKEVTGISAIQYYADGTDQLGDPARIFRPYAGGLDAILGLGGAVSLPGGVGAPGGGAMIATYINDATNPSGPDRNLEVNWAIDPATNCISLADCIAEAAQPELLQVDGISSDPQDFWISGPGGQNIKAVWGLAGDTIVVNVNAGLGTLYNTVLPIIPQDASGNPNGSCAHWANDVCVDFRVTATVNGGAGLSNGAFAHSTSIASSKFVPEPEAIALLGAGLLGMAGFKRRRG